MKCDCTLSLLIVLYVRKCHFSFLKDDYFEFIEDMTEIYFGFFFFYIKNCHSLWINIIHETWTRHYILSLFIDFYVRKCHFSSYKLDFFTIFLYKLGRTAMICHFSSLVMLESVTFHFVCLIINVFAVLNFVFISLK